MDTGELSSKTVLEVLAERQPPQKTAVRSCEVEILAQGLILEAADYLRERGIPVRSTPTVRYLDDKCRYSSTTLAAVREHNNYFLETMGSWAAPELVQLYKDRFGLTITRRAAIQTPEFEYIKRRCGDWCMDIKEDILLFEPILKLQLFELYNVIGHELWHLVERDFGILGSDSIYEGTATYVQREFGHHINLVQFETADFHDIFYDSTALVVASHMRVNNRPISDLLDSSLRKAIQKDFEQDLLPIMAKKLSRLADGPQFRSYLREEIFQGIEFASFYLNPTAKNYLLGLRNTGRNSLADELEKQNLEKMVSLYSNMNEFGIAAVNT